MGAQRTMPQLVETQRGSPYRKSLLAAEASGSQHALSVRMSYEKVAGFAKRVLYWRFVFFRGRFEPNYGR